jgi:hypothetical protein
MTPLLMPFSLVSTANDVTYVLIVFLNFTDVPSTLYLLFVRRQFMLE